MARVAMFHISIVGQENMYQPIAAKMTRSLHYLYQKVFMCLEPVCGCIKLGRRPTSVITIAGGAVVGVGSCGNNCMLAHSLADALVAPAIVIALVGRLPSLQGQRGWYQPVLEW